MKNTLFILLLLIPGILSAQDLDLVNNPYRHEDQYWLKAKVVLPFTKKFEMSAQYIGRMSLGQQFQQGHYMYVSGKYKIKKWLHVDARTRFVVDNGYNLYRLEAGLKVKQEFGDFAFSLRTAGFRENKTYLNTRDMSKAPVNYWRNRFEISWKPSKKLSLSNSFETWNLNNNKYQFKLDKACYIAEVSYDLNKRHEISFSYQNQFDIWQRNRISLNMYCLGYTYTFKRFSK